MRVVEPELGGLRVHQPDELLDAAVPDVGGEREGRVVGALDERGGEKVADGQLLARARGWMLDSPTVEERPETVTTSDGSACSSTTIAVMSFVMLAIGTAVFSFRPREDLPGLRVGDEIRQRRRPAAAARPGPGLLRRGRRTP